MCSAGSYCLRRETIQIQFSPRAYDDNVAFWGRSESGQTSLKDGCGEPDAL